LSDGRVALSQTRPDSWCGQSDPNQPIAVKCPDDPSVMVKVILAEPDLSGHKVLIIPFS